MATNIRNEQDSGWQFGYQQRGEKSWHDLSTNQGLKQPNELATDGRQDRPSASFWFILRLWYFEILSCVVAVKFLVAIVVTLQVYDGRSLPDWPLGITVNALISTFSAILKAAMLVPVVEAISQLKWSWFQNWRPLIYLTKFDEASRGTWGSVLLLWRLRRINLAALGAAITILAMASDPFIQQVVKYETCQRNVTTEVAAVVRTNVYKESGMSCGHDCQTLDLPMQAALYKAAYNSFNEVEPVCPTGNCTFPDFRTLGMCGGCRDISSEIRYLPLQKAPNGTIFPTEEPPKGPEWEWIGRIWIAGYGYLKINLTDLGTIQMRLKSANEYWLPEPDILTKTVLITNTAYDGHNGPHSRSAFECSLWPCVRTYSVHVQKALAYERLISVHNMSRMPGGLQGGYSSIPEPCLINGTHYNLGDLEGMPADKIPTSDVLEHNKTARLPKECYYELPQPLGLSQFLPGFLDGHVNEGPEYFTATSDWMQQLYHSGNATLSTVNKTWANLAESMTIHMRYNGAPGNNTPQYGQTLNTETCIGVRWAWLSLPVVLLALSVGLLLITIHKGVMHTSRHMWKSSPLPLLFHGHDKNLADEGKRLEKVKDMEHKAETLYTKLSDDSGSLVIIDGSQLEGLNEGKGTIPNDEKRESELYVSEIS